jgi:hypothetical protein
VSEVWVNNKTINITSKTIKTALQDAVVAFGKAKLQIQKHKGGTHSMQSGAAMAMCLGGIPEFALIMVGQRSINAFMKYMQKQIEEFTLNISKNMLTMQHF